jgi:hypothetical protein
MTEPGEKAPEQPERRVMEPYVIYINDRPVAIGMATSAEQAISAIRAQSLGDPSFDVTKVRATAEIDTPFEDFVRVALDGIYMRMFQMDAQAGARAAMQGAGGRGKRR